MQLLSEQQVEAFRRDGYLKFGRVIDDARVEPLRGALDRVIAAEQEREDDAGLPPEFAYGQARRGSEAPPGARAIHQFVNMWKVVPEYREAIREPGIVDAVRQLMGVDRVRI